MGYRCASEPIDDWLRKGGEVQATEGRKCLCNALLADAGFPQVSPHKAAGSDEKYVEEPLFTAGDDVNSCRRFMKKVDGGRWSFPAADVRLRAHAQSVFAHTVLARRRGGLNPTPLMV